MEPVVKPKRGLACLSAERRREIARLGGKAVPADKRAFSRDAALASSAGRVGGASVAPEQRMFHQDPALARRAAQASLKVRAKQQD